MRIALIILITLLCFNGTVYAWTEYKNIRYMDLDGDLANEVIIEARHGAGSNHYIEDMRIFKDNYPKLDLIFTVRTLDSTYGFKHPSPYNCDIISSVEFTEPTIQNNGVRDIVVKSKKISYKDDENKVIDKDEILGTKIFKWDGMKFVESKAQKTI